MVESMERIRGVGVGRLLLPHFGEAAAGVDETIEAALEALARWHEAFDSMDPGNSDADRLVERAEGQLDPRVSERFEKVNPGWLNLAGLERERSRLRG
jgi:hypothetical protein